MLSPLYEVNDIKLLLELGESARQTLLIMLNQFNGEPIGILDRSLMNNAEKQKVKRGIKELKGKGVISKSEGLQSEFEINQDIIRSETVYTSEELYFDSGLYNPDYYAMLKVAVAIEHFFDDFFTEKFVIDYYKSTKSPRIPADVFKEIVDFTDMHYKYSTLVKYVSGSILNDLIVKLNFVNSYCDIRQQYFVLDEFNVEEFIYWFKILITDVETSYPSHRKAQADALCRFVEEWFMKNYPEYYI